VNVSPKQLTHRSLIPTVKKALAESGLPAHRLSLEITETALIDDADSAREKLIELKELGVYLELDDFGTGYSSLTFARTFPIDALKIDRSFIEGLAHNDEDHAIVSAVISMARALGLGVVAEGVETAEQASQLRLMGCSLAQGYLFSRPLSPSAALELAAATRSTRSAA
jgi:EAL domain-containing protein (putative c-di-GMP-specific phosphodiesterase class I)